MSSFNVDLAYNDIIKKLETFNVILLTKYNWAYQMLMMLQFAKSR